MLQLLYSIQLYQYSTIFNAKLDVCLCALLCPTLCCPMDCRPPGSSVHGIFQVRLLEWNAISYSRGSSQSRDWTHFSGVSYSSRRILYHWATWETETRCTYHFKYFLTSLAIMFLSYLFSPLRIWIEMELLGQNVITLRPSIHTDKLSYKTLVSMLSMYIFKTILKFWPVIYYQTLI